MSDESQWSAPDPRAAQGGTEQLGADQPRHGQAQDGRGQPMPAPPPGSGGQQPHFAKRGVIPLRPLGLGEILDGAISTIRSYPMLTLGISAIVLVIAEAIDLAVTGAFFPKVDSGPTYNFASSVISTLADIFLTGFLTVVVSRAVIGQRVSFGGVLAQLRPKLLPLLWLAILTNLIVAVASIFFIIPGIWLSVRYLLAPPALVLEPTSARGALRRSRALVRGSWWRTFGIMLLAGIMAAIIFVIITVPFVMLAGTFNPNPASSLGSAVLLAIGTAIAGTIALPFLSTVQILLYVDQRMAREGMDFELARAAGVPVGSRGGRP